MGHQLLVVVFVHRNFFEPVSFVETLGCRVGDLDMEVYGIDLRLCVGQSGGDNMFKALRAQSS